MSNTTINEIITQYLDNSGYSTLESAELYQQAIRQLLIRRPEETIIDGQKIKFNFTLMRDELNNVNSFVNAKRAEQAAAQGNNSYSRTYDLSNIRD